MKVEFFRHNINARDIRNVERVLRSLFLSTGAGVSEFEKRFSKYFGRGYHTKGLTSCTAALHLALQVLGIGKGNEVITTPLSYVATAHAIVYNNATPRFVDVDPLTGNIDLELVERAITKRTRAIIPVHLYGQMVDMKRLRSIAQKHELVVVEDAAHALEASFKGIRPGRLSDAACFSFYAAKSITSGEGGAILTRNRAFAKKIGILRHHGVTKQAAERYGKLYKHYDVPCLGWKYNMDNIQASLLLGQVGRIKKQWMRRRSITKQYARAFQGMGIDFPETQKGAVHAHYLFTIWVNAGKRDAIIHALQRRGIGVAVNYRPIHLMTYYRKAYGFSRGDFPNAERIGASTISLPLYPKLTDREVKYVIRQVGEVCR